MTETAIDVAAERAAVVAEASTWLLTPFHHGARIKGAGVDCAQLLIAVYARLELVPALDVGYYGADWFLHEGEARLLTWVERYLVPTATAGSGDVALFRFGRQVSHAAIVTDWPNLIHAYRGRAVERDRADAQGSMAGRLASTWTLARWRDG